MNSMKRMRAKRKVTTISLAGDTYDELNEFRHGGESWDEFLKRVVRTLAGRP